MVDNPDVATDVQTILKLRVPVIVRIGARRSAMEDVLNFAPGSILELNKASDEELDLMVNNKPIGRGSAVKVGENFGVRISRIGSARERLEAMAE